MLEQEFYESFSYQTRDMTGEKNKKQIRVSSLKKLVGFKRVGTNLLIRESKEDFWTLNNNDDGSVTIERVVDESENENGNGNEGTGDL